jgi:flagellar hook-basal body complex protein FliE
MMTPVPSVVVAAVGGVASPVDLAQAPGFGSPVQEPSATGGFAAMLKQQFDELSSTVKAAESSMENLAASKPVQLHEMMIALERARISVQTFVQVRNKLIESYQDVMRMQL